MASLKKRGSKYYAQYYVGGSQRRVNLDTTSLQIAKEKLRQLESTLFRGDDVGLPTKTPIGKVVASYIEYLKAVRHRDRIHRDIYYLRELFGVVCPSMEYSNRKISRKGIKLKQRGEIPYIEANCFEQITTASISAFIAAKVRQKGIAPKTANRYREIITRLFNWSMKEGGVIMPSDRNPAAKVERYKEKANEIEFMKLEEIDEQLEALKDNLMLQTMIALYIYAGLRREEALWLTIDDIDLKSGPYGMIRIRAKTVGREHWEPKTRVNRVVPISSTLRKYLDRYEPPKVEGGWYFSTPWGHRWIPDNFSDTLRCANRRAKLEWTNMIYRHTFGSQLAMKGESLYKISKLMGNSPEICRRHYAALIPEELAESVEF